MADKRTGNKLPNWASRESTPGVRVDSGPHAGIVKNNVDPARMGRLQVWIPDLGGDELEPSNWYTVSYASPFFGSTVGLPGSSDTGFGSEQQTYGFWAVPPDLGNTVLITFVMGDPNRGFWFACIPNTPVAHMVPGIARPVDNTRVIADAVNIAGRVDSDSYLPVTELNTNSEQASNNPDFVNADKSIHSYQAETVLQQGLDTDPLRGSVTSSVQRETPSRVFGISTPGRTSPDETDFPNFDELWKTQYCTVPVLLGITQRRSYFCNGRRRC
jgi:Type VI secretion system/phage-baseplate injector OB domain